MELLAIKESVLGILSHSLAKEPELLKKSAYKKSQDKMRLDSMTNSKKISIKTQNNSVDFAIKMQHIARGKNKSELLTSQ